MKKTIFSILSGSVIVCSCMKNNSSQNGDVIISNEINMEHKPLNFETTKVENNAHTGKYYSSVDSIRSFAAGYAYVIPDSLKNKNLKVYFSAWVRENQAPLEGGVLVSLTTSKGTIGWDLFDKKKLTYTPGEWVQINDSISYSSAKINENYAEIGVIGMKVNGNDHFDIDDIQIKYLFYK